MALANKTAFLVCYDIRDQKRWKAVHDALLGFGEAVQLSVFRCMLSDSQRVKLYEKLRRVIDSKQDSVIFADLGPADGRGADAVRTLGVGLGEIKSVAIVV